ncbi:MAG TPA: heat-inducible transcriptional repressor HrcA [Actinomycetota bacterium]|nr:heat-inducible transcriptional repressor HrcA [Actinomycetota bacterium]
MARSKVSQDRRAEPTGRSAGAEAPTRRELSERKAAILRALVQQYIRTGEPVSSEALAQTAGLGVSSATIRNELAALEEMGYLFQPHTSSGRAPTDLAYRFFVDMLPARPRLRDAEWRAVVAFFDAALASVDEILRGTTKLLSRLTHYASVALAPSPAARAIVRAELVRVGPGILLLVVFDTGQVERRLVELPPARGEEDLERTSRAITEAFRGLTLSGARKVALERAKGAEPAQRLLLERVAEALAQIEASQAEHVYLGGVSYIVSEEAFRRRETLQRIYEALERESAVLRMLREAVAVDRPISVMIGRENPLPEMWEASVVAAPYRAGSEAVGTIGVVGPTRMDYVAAISAVRAVAERLSRAVEALAG